MVNIVIIGDDKYMVDVGFGSNGPIEPLKLVREGYAAPHIGPASMRLSYESLSSHSDSNQRAWVYSHRINNESPFVVTYSFVDVEFMPSDYETMSYWTSTHPSSIFMKNVVCAKHLLGEPDDEEVEVVGTIILGVDVKWRIGGQKVREEKFETEADRIKALEDVFRIKLTPAERDGIKGLSTELKPPAKFD